MPFRFLSCAGDVHDVRPMRGLFHCRARLSNMGAMSSALGQKRSAFAGVGVMAFVSLGCDAQMTPDYKAKPIESFQGEIRSALEHPVSEAQVAIIWVKDDRAVFEVIVDELSLAADGSTMFDIGLDRAPAGEYLADCTLGGTRTDENHL